MRILIFGGDGMLGHRLLKHFLPAHDVRVTVRREASALSRFGLYNERNTYPEIDVRVTDRLLHVLGDFQPQAVINAVGVVKQRPDGLDPIPNLEINALLPHHLAAICKAIGAYFVHISTDCVFSGRRGAYAEDDEPDPIDVYGHSKLLGEVVAPGCITLRTSIIGRELLRKSSLLEWFLAQEKVVHGYRNAIFSGFTTAEMSRIVEMLISRLPVSSGIYHVSSSPISKLELLNIIKEKFGLRVEVVPEEKFTCNRSLDSARFRREFSYTPPSWESMIEELAAEYRSERQR